MKRMISPEALKDSLPSPAETTEDGTYTLKLVKSGSSITYKWVKDV